VKLLLGCAFVAVFSAGVLLGSIRESRRYAPELRELRVALAVERAEGARLFKRAETDERDEQNIFTWYERCLDGRSCTQAGSAGLEIPRWLVRPELPHNALPACWECRQTPACEECDAAREAASAALMKVPPSRSSRP